MAGVRHKGMVALLVFAILIVFVGIGVRLTFLYIRPAAWIIEPISEGRMLKQKRVGHRGRIVDCKNEILAMDLAAYHVYADPKYISEHGDAELVCKYLSKELHLPIAELRQKLSKTNRQYVRLKKYVPGRKLSRFKRRAYGLMYSPDELVCGVKTNIYLRGIGLEDAPLRNYPKGALMAHVVGFSNHDGVGAAGVEQRMDHYLQGESGLRISKKDG